MMIEIIYIVIGLLLGGIIAFLVAKQKFGGSNDNSKKVESLNSEIQSLKVEVESLRNQNNRSEHDLQTARKSLENKEISIRNFNADLAKANTQLDEVKKVKNDLLTELDVVKKENKDLFEEQSILKRNLDVVEVKKDGIVRELSDLKKKYTKLESDLEERTREFNNVNKLLATANADNKALEEKLDTQKEEIEKLGNKFNLEFQNIANAILDEKTKKFTDVNKESLDAILKPLGENINDFKKRVEEVYSEEAKERFSLEEQVKEMAKLNKVISDEARNLTQALKGEAKTQGNWGEMILESILEKSGLRKDEEYFMEHQLMDDDGKPLRSDSENKKMRPDAVIKYPDNRNVIIDSKVSLNAFTRYLAADDKDTQAMELQSHIADIKRHIVALSTKGYDDYNKALDFVMMFIPSEPAYIAAMQGDADLWNFAYNKRILLMNPTNLITSLKLIVDLWKREYQNQNAIEIADRGAKLYDKFVGFVDSLEAVGKSLKGAQTNYDKAYSQLTDGGGNLIVQVNMLKELGVKNKKHLSESLVNKAKNEIDNK